ncbi:MAG: tetratricopeptide repeat protein [Verrucomicrobiota bacterium]
MKPKYLLSISSLFLLTLGQVQSFTLTDSGPAAPDFRARFLGSYGINSKIEPEVTQEDRPLYEKIEPFLQNDPAGAARELEAGLKTDSTAAFDFLLGNLYYQLDQLDRSEKALRTAIRKFPDFRRAHRTLGFILVQTDRFEASIDTWLKVIALGGGDAQSYGLLAYAYLIGEKYQSALSAYEKARIFKPDSMDFKQGQAQSLLAMNRGDEAIGLFDELIAERPQSTDLWLLQANAYLEQERYEDAIANLEVLRGRGDASRNALQLLGNVHLREDNHFLALEAYETSLRIHGFEGMDQSLRPLEFLVSRGLFPEAERYLATLEAVLPVDLEDDAEIQLSVAKAGLKLEQGDGKAAIFALEPIVKSSPLNGEALLLLAEAFRRGKAFPEAEFYLQRALSVPDKKHEALVALGRLEVDKGDFKNALEFLREADSLKPSAGLKRYIEAIEAAQ